MAASSESESSARGENALRRRQKGGTERLVQHSDINNTETLQQDEKHSKENQARLGTGTFWLTRIVLLRSVAFVYCEYYMLNKLEMKNCNTCNT